MDRQSLEKHLEVCIKKAMTSLVSLKVWIIALSTYLLYNDTIAAVNWQTVVLGITIGRVALQGIDTYNNTKGKNGSNDDIIIID